MFRTLPLLLLAATVAAHGQTTHQLTAIDFAFEPDTIYAVQGDSLHITFGSTTHTFSQVSEETWLANGDLVEGQLNVGPGVSDTTLFLNASGTVYYICIPHVSMGMKGFLHISLTASVPDNGLIAERALYPNPARDQLWMSEPSTSAVDVFFIDTDGREVLRTRSFGTAPLFVGALPTGMYIVRVADMNGRELYRQPLTIAR